MLAIGEKYRPKLEDALAGQEILWLPDNTDVDPRLAGHADLSLFFGRNGEFVAARSVHRHIASILTNRGYVGTIAGEQGSRYPDDVGLCLCSTGLYTIYNPKTADTAAVGRLIGTPIVVSQGYTRCAVCVVTPDSIITSDSGIAAKARQADLDVLEITPGHIMLDGFDYGFIGGASFLLDEHTMAFTGVLDEHPDKAGIMAFLDKHSIRPVFLTNEPIFDIGGAVALP